ncbi:bacillithiol biosynthesis BshC [Candidatus Bathyarchaeota archaeon]|nr:bacillithiol biosynthesis BshC [Candidatus Bathyarchaeota archaeon]
MLRYRYESGGYREDFPPERRETPQTLTLKGFLFSPLILKTLSVISLSEKELPPVHEIYTNYVEKKQNEELAKRLWGSIPANMGEAFSCLEKMKEKYTISPEISGFQKGLKEYHRRMGFLTGKVEESIETLSIGVVEGGQQPNCLGGPSLSLNKMAYAKSLCELGGGYVPVFYHADYDGVQAELINIRLPSPSSRGLLISYPIPKGYENSPIYAVPNPEEEWLIDVIEKMESNYRGLLNGIESRKQENTQHNIEHIITILKTAYYSTDNLSDFAAKILGTLVNIEGDLGIPFVAPSIAEVRQYFQDGYELLLGESERSKFIESSNDVVRLIEDAGYKPQIGYRDEDYVPFFFECKTPDCHRSRVELKYKRTPGSSQSTISGKCSQCNEKYEFTVDPSSPDLSELIDWISPRVDSRQVIVDSIYPVLAHIGGPGETSYYAEVIPAVRPLNIPFPIFLRYTRTFYNTPWGEKMAGELRERGYKTILNDKLFNALGNWVEARNNGEAQKLAEAHKGIRESINLSYKELLESLDIIEREIYEIKEKLSTSEDREPLIEELKEKQRESNNIEHYLSVAYGRFSPEKFGQEVSWAWMDLALTSGVTDVLGVYRRMYNKHTPNSSMFFVNT